MLVQNCANNGYHFFIDGAFFVINKDFAILKAITPYYFNIFKDK